MKLKVSLVPGIQEYAREKFLFRTLPDFNMKLGFKKEIAFGPMLDAAERESTFFVPKE